MPATGSTSILGMLRAAARTSAAISAPSINSALARPSFWKRERSSLVLPSFALSVKDGKTKELRSRFQKLGLANALLIDGAEIAADVRAAARNIPNIDVLPVAGINVYDVMRRHKLVLTRAAVEALEARFK